MTLTPPPTFVWFVLTLFHQGFCLVLLAPRRKPGRFLTLKIRGRYTFHQINTDIQQLITFINTSYSNKDDEGLLLISNASDALDKIRYAFMTGPDNFDALPNFYIKIIPAKTNSIITIVDSDIGMTKNEQMNNTSMVMADQL